jgi:hypothetical protein
LNKASDLRSENVQKTSEPEKNHREADTQVRGSWATAHAELRKIQKRLPGEEGKEIGALK